MSGGKLVGKWIRVIQNQKGDTNYQLMPQTLAYWILIVTFFAFYFISKFWSNEGLVEKLQTSQIAFDANTNQSNFFNSNNEATEFSSQLMQLQNTPSASPLSNAAFKISSEFGFRIHPIDKTKKFHNGIDMATPNGTPVYATANGQIQSTGNQPNGLGKFIVVQHSLGYQSIYGHLQEALIKEGDTVAAHQMIALSGNSGKTTGPHLHYAVLKDTINLNPMPTLNLKYEFLKSRLALNGIDSTK